LVGFLNRDGKMPIDDLLYVMIKVLPPLHELARSGLDLPTYLGELQREAQRQQAASGNGTGADGTASDQTSPAHAKPTE
jgi:hypothetical protein